MAPRASLVLTAVLFFALRGVGASGAESPFGPPIAVPCRWPLVLHGSACKQSNNQDSCEKQDPVFGWAEAGVCNDPGLGDGGWPVCCVVQTGEQFWQRKGTSCEYNKWQKCPETAPAIALRGVGASGAEAPFGPPIAVPCRWPLVLHGSACKQSNNQDSCEKEDPVFGWAEAGVCNDPGLGDGGWPVCCVVQTGEQFWYRKGLSCEYNKWQKCPETAPAIALRGVGASGQLPTTMRAMQKTGLFPCSGPTWECLSLNSKAPVPQLKSGHALVKVMGSSVNPKDLECVEPICLLFPLKPSIPFRCSKGTLGGDSTLNGDCSGVVVAAGDSCPGIKVGDEVFGFCLGAYAEYALASCDFIRPKPTNLTFVDAGSLPGVAVTGVEVFTATGAPWTPSDNKTIVITAGQGGTGFIAVQIAKMLGAARVITAATGAGIPLLKSLGADVVIDYHKQELFDALKNDTVDVVFDNHGGAGTADSAMRALRAGGVFLLLTGGGKGTLSKNPKAGVKQVQFPIFTPSGHSLDILADGFNKGLLRPHTDATFSLSEVPQAFTRITGHGILGKISVDPSNASASEEEPAVLVV